MLMRPRKKYCFFPVSVQNKIGEVVWYKNIFWIILLFKCMFYVDWELEGQKKLYGRDFLNKNLLGSGYRKQTTFFRPDQLVVCG